MGNAEEKLGCPCLFVGSEGQAITPNVASSVGRAFGSVMRFFRFATDPPPAAIELGESFAAVEAKAAGISTSVSSTDGGKTRSANANIPQVEHRGGSSTTLLGRIYSLTVSLSRPSAKKSSVQQHTFSSSLSVSDFDLLRVVGKGAFGKVMLVRKKRGHAS